MPLIKSNNWPTLKKPSEFEFNMNSYISQLPDYTGIFGNINGIKVPYIVDAYRHYLRNRGYQNYYISNENILKLLENLYKTLVKDLKGEAAKGKIFWNFGYTPRTTGHPERSAMYETVDLSKFFHGGMYFSRGKNYLPSSFSEYMDNSVDIRPFLIDNIDNITYNTKIVRNHPEHTLYVDPAEPYGRFDNMIWNNNDKFLLFYTTHTSGIKTIFPHPENLIKNEDGTFKIIRDWSDNRFGY